MSVRPRLSALLFALALCAGPAAAQERREIPEFRVFGQPESQTDAAAVDALIAAYIDAWGREDAGALAALHADDIEWINAYARIFRGREPLRAFMAERMFPAFDPDVSRREAEAMEILSIRYLGDDAAVVHVWAGSGRGAARDESGAERRVHVHFVLEERDGRWQVAHVAIMDAR
jgi:uncharacterized protein (TIGR02246 family)